MVTLTRLSVNTFMAFVVGALISTGDFVCVKIFSIYISMFAIRFAENSEIA